MKLGAVNDLFVALRHRAGIDRRVAPHALRHAFTLHDVMWKILADDGPRLTIMSAFIIHSVSNIAPAELRAGERLDPECLCLND